MALRVLLPLAALVAFAAAAPASLEQQPKSQSILPAYRLFFPNLTPPREQLKHVGGGNSGIFSRASQKCEQRQRKMCQDQFASDLGQDSSIFTDPQKFEEVVYGVYRNPLNGGLLNLCRSQVNFRTCLNFFYDACTDAYNIYRGELKDINKAFELAGVYDDIEFDCGGGFTQGVVNWNCIMKVNSNSNLDPLIQNCLNDYKEATKNGTNYCPAGQTLSICFANAYKQVDSCVNSAVAWWACERVNRRTRQEGFCDTNTCASLFPAPTTTPPSQLRQEGRADGRDELIDFVASGGLISEARYKFFQLVGLTREHRIALAKQHKI